MLWIASDFAALEAGDTYGLGCDLFGLAARELVIVKVARATDALWAMEEALKCRALAAAVAELPNDAPLADLTATRRLTLAAREGGGFGFLLRHRGSALTKLGRDALARGGRAGASRPFRRARARIVFTHPSQKSPWPDRPLDHRLEPS